MYASLMLRRFYRDRQEDAHEFLLHLLANDAVAATLSRVRQTPLLRCSACGLEILREHARDNFVCRALQVVTDGHVASSVQEAVDMSLCAEAMDPDFIWSCPCCADSSPPSKRMTIEIHPQVLCIQLTRWQGHAAGQMISTPIDPDAVLTMENEVYDL